MIIGGRRGCGKTTELIHIASEKDLYIVCASYQRVKHVAKLADKLELKIKYPITIEELPLRSSFIKEVLVDDMEDVLCSLIGKPIYKASTSMEIQEM
ncbi:hypothetical protein P4V41_07870 [Fictibacillus nanhaiensis]|uniref:hypothetical protein n=1 Tax=Fictibacillus nanhaiensis TaxID=742169 RepID=UPI002E1DBCC7|nr:hypothetical protein [Fictibacillus nanhaiensis]